MTTIETLSTTEEVVAAANSRLYRLLADGFAYPERELFAQLKAGGFRDDVEAACASLPYDLEAALDGLVAAGEYVDFQAEYLRLFDVAMGIPPCPLFGGSFRGGRKAVMEELSRFYNFFGLSTEHGSGELPDHLTTELEFMHFLTFKELTALHGERDSTPYRRAQADFLERQLVSWLPALETRLRGQDPPPFYAALVWLTNAMTQANLVELKRTLAASVATALEE